ncbi:hypothetical protein Tco_1385641 [Tanacetum coccineum]
MGMACRIGLLPTPGLAMEMGLAEKGGGFESNVFTIIVDNASANDVAVTYLKSNWVIMWEVRCCVQNKAACEEFAGQFLDLALVMQLVDLEGELGHRLWYLNEELSKMRSDKVLIVLNWWKVNNARSVHLCTLSLLARDVYGRVFHLNAVCISRNLCLASVEGVEMVGVL